MVHGTNGGYIQHRKNKKKPCQLCRDAHAAYQARWRTERQIESKPAQYPKKPKASKDTEVLAVRRSAGSRGTRKNYQDHEILTLTPSEWARARGYNEVSRTYQAVG